MSVGEAIRAHAPVDVDRNVNPSVAATLQQCASCPQTQICIGTHASERTSRLTQAARLARKTAGDRRARVALCGNEPIPRNALHVLIAARGEKYQVVGETAICPHAARLMGELDLDVALLDFDLTDVSQERLSALQSLLSVAGRLPVLVLTRDLEPEACRLAFQFGARGLILKSKALEDLFGALDRIARGESWVEGRALAKLLQQGTTVKKVCAADQQIALLTKREREIVQVVACGRSNDQVAQQLFISEVTVRHHLCAIFEKLGVATRGELIVFAYRHRIADRSFLESH